MAERLMPTYVYECLNHGKDPLRKYVSRSIKDTPEVETCVQCGKVMLRVYNAPAVTFMGGGWGKDR